jgi:hypothetical protein
MDRPIDLSALYPLMCVDLRCPDRVGPLFIDIGFELSGVLCEVPSCDF